MQRKIKLFLIAMLVSFALVISNTPSFGDSLTYKNEEVVSVLVYLKDHVDIQALNTQMDRQLASLKDRHETTVVSLQQKAAATQPKLVEYLDGLKSQDIVKDYHCFWIGNIIRVDTYQSVVDQIALRDDVLRIYPNYGIEHIAPVYEGPVSKQSNGRDVEIGLEAIRAPEVWNNLSITGEGVLVANLDTGVDGNHPALASRWAGVADPRYEDHPEWAWYDPYAGQNDFPYDNNGHGTHTMGTVCGGEPGDQVGVAPGALWIAAAPIDRGGGIPRTVSDAILSFEWLIDPDGDPSTNWDVPDVCSNSWRLTTGHGYPPCDDLFWSYLDACEAAGTVIIFSAGNEGFAGLGRPPDRATDDYRCFAVAAVDANDPDWPIADFSSRGPTYCTPNGDEAIKPDIAAPGVSVRSSVPGGGYGPKSGTSMASPHINGVVALMRSAAPNLSVEVIKEIIFQTAYDLGSEGEDNDYGWGMVDAYEAVLSTSDSPETPTVPEGPDEWIISVETSFSTSADEPDGEDVYYKFNWGDGNFSEWIGPFCPGVTGTANHTWEALGDYEIRAIAKDIHGVTSNWSDPAFLSIVENVIPTTPDIEGKQIGFGGKEYEFSFESTDEDGHEIFYKVDWDDGEETEWKGPFPSGTKLLLAHTWTKNGRYFIKAWAKDTMGGESNQGNHQIYILKDKAKTSPIFYNFLLKFPVLRYILGLY
jgi:subtilisin family serine protease